MTVRRYIENVVRRHPLVVFMKGTPRYPMCADSASAVEALTRAGVPFHAEDVQQNPFLRAALPRYANWSDIPQVYLHGDLIGGSAVLLDLLESGELARMAEGLTGTDA